MTAIAAIIWCFLGSTSLIWLGWDREAYTWGDLFFAVVMGCLLGPLIWAIIMLKILVLADFWRKPIFGKSK